MHTHMYMYIYIHTYIYRVHRGKGWKMRCISLVGRQLWCGSRQIKVFDADLHTIVNCIDVHTGVVKCMLQIALDGSSVPASNMQATCKEVHRASHVYKCITCVHVCVCVCVPVYRRRAKRYTPCFTYIEI
jgi:hypothetical protein